MLTTHAAPRATTPAFAPTQTTVITRDTGLRFEGRVRSHRVVVDQPLRAGGDDTAPTPIELLGVALGSCVAIYVTRFLDARVLPHEGLRVEVDRERSDTHSGVGAFLVRVLLPIRVSDRQLALLEHVARSCPVHHTLERGVRIDVEVLQP